MHTRKKHVIKVQGQSKGISSQRKRFVLGREPFIYRRADSGQVIGIMIDSFNSHRKIRTHHSTGQIHMTRGVKGVFQKLQVLSLGFEAAFIKLSSALTAFTALMQL